MWMYVGTSLCNIVNCAGNHGYLECDAALLGLREPPKEFGECARLASHSPAWPFGEMANYIKCPP